ncbi:MAG: hypothetical protein K2Y71_12075 [Xanthobacteraceae bacterium]|nr:hypothetical protein [Xanthobacteraceae bacterium]
MFTVARTLLLALVLAGASLVAGADDLGDFADAVERAELQYRIALRTLESSGREQTAAEVRLFRDALQEAIAQLDKRPPPKSDGDESYAASMMQIDVAIIGALIVIDIGSREAARAALTPIGDRLAQLRERVERR